MAATVLCCVNTVLHSANHLVVVVRVQCNLTFSFDMMFGKKRCQKWLISVCMAGK